MVERLGNLRFERDEGLARVFDLSTHSLHVELGCNALRASLCSEVEDLLFEIGRLFDQYQPLLLVAKVHVGLSHFS